MKNSSRLAPLYTGVSLVYWGLFLFLIAILSAVPLLFAFMSAFQKVVLKAAADPNANAQNAINTANTAIYVVYAWLALLVVAQILSFVGPIVCIGAPAEMEGKSLIIIAVIF